MSGCRIIPKVEIASTTIPSSGQPMPDISVTSADETVLVTDSTAFDRFLKTTTMESVPSKQNIENIEENDAQPAASEIEEFATMNFIDFNETEVFNVSTATGGGKSYNGGGVQFKHDIMPFENELENSTEYRIDVEEMFQKYDGRRPIRGIESTERSTLPEQLTPFLRRNTRETLRVRCHNAGTFFSARERWWYIAVANCGTEKGLDISYKFKMTNGKPGDFWSEHYSADETRMSFETFYFLFSHDFLFSNLNSFFCSHSTDSIDRSHCVFDFIGRIVLLHHRIEDNAFVSLHVSFVWLFSDITMVWRFDSRHRMDEIRFDRSWAAHNGWCAIYEWQRDYVSVTFAIDGQRIYNITSTTFQLFNCKADNVH